MNPEKDTTVLQTNSYEILQDLREFYKIVQDGTQNPMESSTILGKMPQHLRQEAKNLFKKKTSSYLRKLMERGGFKKILLNLYHIKNLNGKLNTKLDKKQ